METMQLTNDLSSRDSFSPGLAWDLVADPGLAQTPEGCGLSTAIGGPGAKSRALHIVLTSVSSDSHTWNLVAIQLLLEYMGHRVTNLGACTPDEDVIDACRCHSPDLLVVSTINGHGNIDGERLIRRIRDDPQLARMPAVIGGKLGIHGANDYAALSDRLLFAGYSGVFDASAPRESETLRKFGTLVKKISTNKPYLHLAGAHS